VAEVESIVVKTVRKRGRVVDGTSLENWQWGNPFVSSNLTASANREFDQIAGSDLGRRSVFATAREARRPGWSRVYLTLSAI
jgi:hypothetical protein